MARKTVELIMSDKWVLTAALESQPTTENGSPQHRFIRAVEGELMQCVQYAMEDACAQPQIHFSDATDHGDKSDQIICEFTVNDMARVRGDSYNWHGQNTSRWCYAGAVVFSKSSDRVSTHH